MTELSRRRLIQGAALTAAVAAVPAANAAGKPKFDEMHDVVVVGSGFAGLAAALAAREAGADVLVIDKMAFVGGNSSLSGGMMAVPGSSVQKAQGIKDSPAQLMADMTRIGLGLGDPDHIRFVCEKASDTFEWTRRYIGVEWNEHLTGKGGHSASRCMITKQGLARGSSFRLLPNSKSLAPKSVPVFSWRKFSGPMPAASRALRSVRTMSSGTPKAAG